MPRLRRVPVSSPGFSRRRRGTGWTCLDPTGEPVEQVGPDVSAKDFRTWHATVLAAVALAVSLPVAGTPTARRRAVTRACAEVSQHLGNTPSVRRSSSVDPRVIDLFGDGVTIAPALEDLGADGFGHPATHGAVEQAVRDLLHTDPDAVTRSIARGRRPVVASDRLSVPGAGRAARRDVGTTAPRPL